MSCLLQFLVLQTRVVEKYFSGHQLTPDNIRLTQQSLQHGLEGLILPNKFQRRNEVTYLYISVDWTVYLMNPKKRQIIQGTFYPLLFVNGQTV
jgi:hypothetical protein